MATMLAFTGMSMQSYLEFHVILNCDELMIVILLIYM
jgi:hypothetical protein